MSKYLILLLLTGCTSLSEGQVADSIQITYVEAGGMWSIITGRVSSCTAVVTRNGITVKELYFDANENDCRAVVGKDKPEEEIPE